LEEVEEDDENSLEIPIDEEDVQEKTEKDWMNQFGLRHCYVKLHDLVSYIGRSLYFAFLYFLVLFLFYLRVPI